MKFEGYVTLVKYDDRPRMALESVIKKPKALLMTMIDDRDRVFLREGKIPYCGQGLGLKFLA